MVIAQILSEIEDKEEPAIIDSGFELLTLGIAAAKATGGPRDSETEPIRGHQRWGGGDNN